MTDDPLAKYLPLKDAAERMQVSYRTLERMVQEGRIAAIKHGGRLRIADEEIDDYFARLQKEGAKKRTARAKTRRPRTNRQAVPEPEAAAG